MRFSPTFLDEIRARVTIELGGACFIAAAFLTGCLGLLFKFRWEDMQKGIVDSIHKAMPAILIMLSVGVLVGAWMASGTIPMVIYYGLKLISPKFFLATACLVCSIVSLATGRSQILCPNCLRSFVYSIVTSRARRARPTPIAATMGLA